MLHNDILKYVLFPLLGPHDLCASAQVCKQWRDAAVHVSKKRFRTYMLQHYECAGMYNAYITTAEHGPTPQAIVCAIQYNRIIFITACLRDGHIPEVTFLSRHTGDAANLKTYLESAIIMLRDNIFTMLYMRGGWYFPNLLVTAAQHGNLHACKQMYHRTHPDLWLAVQVAHEGRKEHIARYLDPTDKYGSMPDHKTRKSWNQAFYGEDVDVPDTDDNNDTAALELFS